MNRPGSFLSVIEWPRTLRYISWTIRAFPFFMRKISDFNFFTKNETCFYIL